MNERHFTLDQSCKPKWKLRWILWSVVDYMDVYLSSTHVFIRVCVWALNNQPITSFNIIIDLLLIITHIQCIQNIFCSLWTHTFPHMRVVHFHNIWRCPLQVKHWHCLISCLQPYRYERLVIGGTWMEIFFVCGYYPLLGVGYVSKYRLLTKLCKYLTLTCV